MKRIFVDEFTSILVNQGAITKKEADIMVKDFKGRSNIAFDNFLLEEGLISKENLLKALSQYYKIPSFDVSGYFFDHDLLINFPKDFLLENLIIPLVTNGDFLTVIASDPWKPNLAEKIMKYTSYDVEFLVGIAMDIENAITEYYDEPLTYIKDIEDDDEAAGEILDEPITVDEIINKKRW